MNKFCFKFLSKIFLAIFFIGSVNVSNLGAQNYAGSGIIPYYKKDGQTFLLFSVDNWSKNIIWGDFGGERKFPKLSLKQSAAMYAHEGSMGVFSNTRFNPAIKEARRHGENYFLNIMQEEKAFVFSNKFRFSKIYFVPVEYVTAAFFMHLLYNNIKHPENGQEFVRRTGFAWVNLQELLAKIEEQKGNQENLRLISYDFATYYENVFSAHCFEIVLNKYLSQELKTQQAIDVLKQL